MALTAPTNAAREIHKLRVLPAGGVSRIQNSLLKAVPVVVATDTTASGVPPGSSTVHLVMSVAVAACVSTTLRELLSVSTVALEAVATQVPLLALLTKP